MPEFSVIDWFNNYAKTNAFMIIAGSIGSFIWTAYFAPKIMKMKGGKWLTGLFHAATIGVGVYGLYLNYMDKHPPQQANYTYNYYYQ